MRLILFGASFLYCSFLSASEYPSQKPPVAFSVQVQNAAPGGAFDALSSFVPVYPGIFCSGSFQARSSGFGAFG